MSSNPGTGLELIPRQSRGISASIRSLQSQRSFPPGIQKPGARIQERDNGVAGPRLGRSQPFDRLRTRLLLAMCPSQTRQRTGHSEPEHRDGEESLRSSRPSKDIRRPDRLTDELFITHFW